MVIDLWMPNTRKEVEHALGKEIVDRLSDAEVLEILKETLTTEEN